MQHSGLELPLYNVNIAYMISVDTESKIPLVTLFVGKGTYVVIVEQTVYGFSLDLLDTGKRNQKHTVKQHKKSQLLIMNITSHSTSI